MAEHTNKPGEHGHSHDENPEVSYERKDVNIVQITGFGIGLLISVLISVLAMWMLFRWFTARENAKNVQNPPAMNSEMMRTPPEPRLQAEPIGELAKMHESEQMILDSYGWVNGATGTVHIPIAEAIDMVAAKGLPSNPSPAGLDHDGYRMLPSDASSGRTLEKISR